MVVVLIRAAKITRMHCICLGLCPDYAAGKPLPKGPWPHRKRKGDRLLVLSLLSSPLLLCVVELYLFTLVLAGALNELRWTKTISLDRPVPPITIAGLPLDTEYADDVDFNDKEEENLGAILPQATAILEKWNLFVNEDKTDFTHAYLSSMGEVDSDGN